MTWFIGLANSSALLYMRAEGVNQTSTAVDQKNQNNELQVTIKLHRTERNCKVRWKFSEGSSLQATHLTLHTVMCDPVFTSLFITVVLKLQNATLGIQLAVASMDLLWRTWNHPAEASDSTYLHKKNFFVKKVHIIALIITAEYNQ